MILHSVKAGWAQFVCRMAGHRLAPVRGDWASGVTISCQRCHESWRTPGWLR